MLIVESQSLDVYRNLAIEEILMGEVLDRGPILFLWRSAEAVVMGKNQNPWRECHLDLMRAEGVPLARRVSGGGAVYHDEGNLNYCVITGREEYREQKAFELIFQTLASFGIKAERTGKSNLSVAGLKFSGNAFAFRKGRAMHHGTLLLNTDLKKLGRYLGPMLEGIDTRAIASEPADVANLGVGRGELAGALKRFFQTCYGGGAVEEWSDTEIDGERIQALLKVRMSDDWLFGGAPRFSLMLDGERVEVFKGVVVGGRFAGQDFKELAFSLVC